MTVAPRGLALGPVLMLEAALEDTAEQDPMLPPPQSPRGRPAQGVSSPSEPEPLDGRRSWKEWGVAMVSYLSSLHRNAPAYLAQAEYGVLTANPFGHTDLPHERTLGLIVITVNVARSGLWCEYASPIGL